jgi:uncharacterized protein YcnI
MTKTRQIYSIFLLTLFSFSISLSGLAKVSLTPDQSLPNTTQVFTLGVAAVKDSEIVKIKLAIPEGVENVVANVNRGWNIEVKKDGDKYVEVQWVGGIIPKDQREDFVFEGKTSSKEQGLKWKVYETYRDGVEVVWDQEPKSASFDADNKSNETPYINTKITKDVKNLTIKEINSAPSNWIIFLSIFSLLLSIFSISKASKR